MRVLVAIKSCWKYRQRREAQRLTWLPKLADWATDHLYVVGRHPSTGAVTKLSDIIDGEARMFIHPESDDFTHIAPKVKAVCRRSIARDYDLTVILDDDTYVVPERLIALCREHYDGRFDITAHFRSEPSHYPQGAAYIMNRRATLILASSHVMDRKGPDDVLAGLAFGQSPNALSVWHTNKLQPGPQRLVTPLKSNDVVTAHKCLPHDMIAAHFDWLTSNV